MPPAPTHYRHGFSTESAVKVNNILFHQAERRPAPVLDEVAEQELNWECLWVDVGGEG